MPNRRRLEEALAHEWRRAERYGQPLSVALVDIDHFKRVNDEHGHAAGDQVLRVVASCLQRLVRSADVVGRWGGEEFLAVLTAPVEGAAAAGEGWRREIAQLEVRVGDAVVRPRVSVGVAERSAQTSSTASLVASADAALYAAKRAGRNRVESGRLKRGATRERPPG
jgi:diguanylate cyclase (GGDEF)-like protein